MNGEQLERTEITVTGRVSGQPVAHTVSISAGGAEVTAAARPITDPKLDVAAEVRLQREARHA